LTGYTRSIRTVHHPLKRGNIMTKLLSALVAATFAAASLTPVAFAADKSAKKGETLAEACVGKKTGDEVTVDGKTMKCPASAEKKSEKAK
jgi:hypothetical protein